MLASHPKTSGGLNVLPAFFCEPVRFPRLPASRQARPDGCSFGNLGERRHHLPRGACRRRHPRSAETRRSRGIPGTVPPPPLSAGDLLLRFPWRLANRCLPEVRRGRMPAGPALPVAARCLSPLLGRGPQPYPGLTDPRPFSADPARLEAADPVASFPNPMGAVPRIAPGDPVALVCPLANLAGESPVMRQEKIPFVPG